MTQERLDKKVQRAQRAFVKAGTTKETTNCRYHGRKIGDNICVCSIWAKGHNESTAGQCWNEKAARCPDFVLAKSEETLRDEFLNLTEEELRVRWPSIGELLWIKRQIEEQLNQVRESEAVIKDDPTKRVG